MCRFRGRGQLGGRRCSGNFGFHCFDPPREVCSALAGFAGLLSNNSKLRQRGGVLIGSGGGCGLQFEQFGVMTVALGNGLLKRVFVFGKLGGVLLTSGFCSGFGFGGAGLVVGYAAFGGFQL